MKKLLVIAFISTGLFYWAPEGEAARYQLDKAHTHIGFITRHLGVVNVPGRFHEYEGHLEYDGEDLSSLRFELTVQAATIDTSNERRDEHLRSEDFFEVETYPEIRFVADRAEERDGQKLLIGVLTMKDTTRDVELPIALSGPVEDPWGNQRVGLEIRGSIERHDFGVGFDGMTDRTIGDSVRFDVNVQVIREAEE